MVTSTIRTLPLVSRKYEVKELYNKNYKMPGHRAPIRHEGRYSDYIKKVNNRINQAYSMNRPEILKQHNLREEMNLLQARKFGYDYKKAYNAKALFTASVKDLMKQGFDVNDSIRIVLNSEYYTPKTVRGQRDAIIFLKEHSDIYQEFRRIAGWKKKIDWTKLEWDDVAKVYRYGNAELELNNYTGPDGARVHKVTLRDISGKEMTNIWRFDEDGNEL